MIVSAVRPWRTALQRERSLPSSVVGPVLLRALRRLASICLRELMDHKDWVRFVSCEYVAIRFWSVTHLSESLKLPRRPTWLVCTKRGALGLLSTVARFFGRSGWLHKLRYRLGMRLLP